MGTSIDDIVIKARGLGCSDIHFTVGKPCLFRRNGLLESSGFTMTPEETQQLIFSICSEAQKLRVLGGADLDFAFVTSAFRQRANIFHQQGLLACAVRLLSDTIPSIAQLGLPPIVTSLADQPRGLVLVTGPTGSGKSTTLAAMIDHINSKKAVHILTIEDPVEYLHFDKLSRIHQRELGHDVGSFAEALRSSLREDPDVILVGEMRDFETISAAVTAAETGHLVLSTLHTTGASQTIDRIVDVCPPQSQQQMRIQLSTILKGVVTQALIPTADGLGRAVATEILLGSDAVLNLIRESKSYQLTSCMQSGGALGMHTFDSDLSRLVREKRITKQMALNWAFSPRDLNI
ncbi:MAG: PilT/PilU family type 4a pilus ATPase [Oscillospiraceae bacterium]